jgi:hypothetical protein
MVTGVDAAEAVDGPRPKLSPMAATTTFLERMNLTSAPDAGIWRATV